MTDKELVAVVEKYWLTRGTPNGPAHWKAIIAEFKRRKGRGNTENRT